MLQRLDVPDESIIASLQALHYLKSNFVLNGTLDIALQSEVDGKRNFSV